jgi:uncharacterized protein (TIGR02271 family)
MFDSRAEAERAVEDLVSAVGLDRSAIGMEAGSAAATTPAPQEKSFFASLKDFFVPDEDRHTYAEGLRRGSVLVTAQVDEARLNRAMGVLEQHGAVDLDEREAAWRQSGWTSPTVAAGMAGGGTGVALGAVSDGERTGIAATPVSTSDGASGNLPGAVPSRGIDQAGGVNISGTQSGMGAGASAHSSSEGTVERLGPAPDEASIAVVEERLQVGKREVGRGSVRVRSYVVETPVEEQVTLHQEHVEVERRTVDRPLADATQASFADRTIEATETAEEVVVSKNARIKEEVVIQRNSDDRTKTISDTVRHTEVEVEDDRVSSPISQSKAADTKTRGPDVV